MNTRLRWLIAGTGAALYAVSFALPVMGPILRSAPAPYSGAEAFQWGWECLKEWDPAETRWWVGTAAWLANPAIWIAVIVAGLGRWRIGALAGFYGLALCLVPLSSLSDMVVGYPAYWTWIASAAFLFVACAAMICRQPNDLPVRK